MSHSYDVVSSRHVYDGRVISLRVDEVRMPGDRTSPRDVVMHPGAVGVVALDDDGRVALVEQYRHPVGKKLWELPAGIRDVDGEPMVETARRELVEEAGIVARRWDVLLDAFTSPGMTDEAVRVFLARDLSPAGERPEVEFEELDMRTEWVDLDEACSRVLRGEIRNVMCVAGVLAAARARDGGWAELRPVE